MDPLPGIRQLGADLLVVSRWDILISFLRPALCFTLFWVLAFKHSYILAAIAVAGWMFFTYTSVSHDLVHRTFHLPGRVNEWLLVIVEVLALRSGHAFRLTHLHHHKRFPHQDDIEGARASKGFWTALACGPGNQIRLFAWAWRRANSDERKWM